MLGEKLRELREAKSLVQRQVAAVLEVDTAYYSKMESNEKPVSRINLKKLAKLFSVNEEELHSIWLADKIYDVVKDEDLAFIAIQLVLEQLKTKSKTK